MRLRRLFRKLFQVFLTDGREVELIEANVAIRPNFFQDNLINRLDQLVQAIDRNTEEISKGNKKL